MNKTTLTKIGSLISYGFAVAGLVFLIFTKHLFAVHPVGIIIQLLSFGLMIWARITFGFRSFHAVANTTRGGLVTHGPYRILRHPIYASVIYFTWAGVLSYPFSIAVAAALLITLSLIARMLLEEIFLKVTYPEYIEYSEHSYMLLPFLI
ncbi:MAG: hypothetical protein NTW10_05665 [Bacteroidetes bacterium]|nr:hypothetical protein [Bacteroidota bacterium]